ncbi:programmed cell death 6-interacting protein [Contarinia nasturtii]|uniref:programmed cell death 6-interacting protein n=1 Tax=Contarinia nasturtii TaxID=265458 RepID=UPI0012D45D40|nr:programmed cell death 6-interacting protein [Contarinia nasturtii]XP_031617799.1 programmed cell death 6-interacting protein [Contarinia nasturtii]
MSELLVVPLKKPSEVDVVKPLKNLIQSSYSGNDAANASDHSESINEFSKLRNSAIWKAFEKYESSLDILYGYYDQLCSLEAKIPVHELQIPFKWKDAFDKGSIFGGRISLTLTSLAYEKECVLFNIAALQSAVAASQSTDSDDGLKMATKLLQQAAGIFAHLRGVTPFAIPQEPTPDLNPETLQVLSNLMLAQAQEIFVMKAIKDSMKDLIIAKLACQCEELYAEALRGLQKDSLRSIWDKDWVATIAGKQAGFHAITQFYQSLVCRNNKAVGEEIARLQNAVELFKAAQSRSGKPSLYEEFASRAQRHLTESKKDNDFIYNEIIPDVKTLEGPGKAQLAKASAFTTPLSPNSKDLFADLVPVALHQAISASDARKNEIVNGEVMRLRESTQNLNGILASLNLPAAIEITSGNALPQSVLDKAKDIREKGGIENLRTLINDLPESLKRNQEILDESDRILNEEAEADTRLRTQFKEKWTRTPSDKLTEMFRSNAAKYREIIRNATTADKTVRDTFDKHSHGMELLSKSESELENACPVSSGGNISNCHSVQELRKLMDNVDTIKAEREVIESELKSATVDLKEQFLSALAQDGAINEPNISIGTIGKALAPLREQVNDSIARQESLVQQIQSAHQAFVNETGGGSGSRDTFLSELASAYDAFTTLQNNLKEGTKFYNDLTQLLITFQNKVSDFCFARKTEKDELMKSLTEESSRMSSAPSGPPVPSYGATTGGSSAPSQPPAQPTGSIPYPSQIQGMPVPYQATPQAPYPTYVAPMPQSFNPYATLPYPANAYNYQNFPQGPQNYGTYPGSYGQQPQQPGGYPHPPPQGYPQAPNWPPQ